MLGLGMVVIVLLGPVLHRQAGDVAFNILGVVQGLLVLRAVRLATAANTKHALLITFAIGLILRLALLFIEPHLSTDAFRYVWDGRVQGAGINPYRYVPSAPELAWLRDTAIFPFINRADYAVTIYPPAAEMLFFLVGRIADGLLAMRLTFIAFEVVTVAVLLDLLRRIGQPPARVIAYVWHPLAIWEIAGSAHIDAAMVALMMCGIWIVAVLRRPVAGAAMIALAAMMKPLAALALPFAWRPWDWRAPAAAVAVVILVYLPYLSVGTGMFQFVGGYLQEESINSGEAFWPVWLLTSVAGPLTWAKPLYLLGAAGLLVILALRLAFATDETTKARLRRLSWLALAGIFALSPANPWYFLILVPFVVLVGSPPLWAATICCYLLYDLLGGDLYIPFWVRDGILHVAVIAGCLWMLLRPKMQDGRRDAGTVAPVSGTAAPAGPAVPAAKVAVAIICKTPITGKSKTRLSPPLRPEECAEISACFITDLGSTIGGLDRAIAAGCAVYTPAGSEMALRSLLPADFQLVLQGEGDLGDRLLQGVTDLLAAGYAGAILINSDSPTLPPTILQAAIEAVRDGDKVVLSPAIDGGYTLIGLSCAYRRLFQDIPWSTEVVFQLTLDRAREIGLPVVILDPWYDIDDAGSYAMLEAELGGQRPSFAKPTMPLQDAPTTRLFIERRRAAATSSKVQ